MVSAIVLKNADTVGDLVDWGTVAKPNGKPVSKEDGILLFRNEDRSSEMGVWQCTPGKWRCEVVSDEFMYILSGRCRYVSDSGEVTEISSGDTAVFPKDWQGECEVFETIRKVYMCR